jgi:hypothetical protein
MGIDLRDGCFEVMMAVAHRRTAIACVGLAIVMVHIAGYIFISRGCSAPNLSVDIEGPLVDSKPSLTGTVPTALRSRVKQSWLGNTGPGLHRLRWHIDRRGGQSESVAATQLVGPFIDPSTTQCTGRVVVGQSLLQATTGQGSVSSLVAKLIDENLHGLSIFGLGDYRSTNDIALRWAQLSKHQDDRSMFPDELAKTDLGYLRVTLNIHFEHVAVPMTLGLVPELRNNKISMRMYSRARLEFGNRLLQWASDKVGGDKIATKLARKEVNQLTLEALAPPPPVPLPGGGTLRFRYCDQAMQFVDGAYAALPMAVEISSLAAAPTILPPRFGPPSWPAVPSTTSLALDLSLDGVNSVLFECWRQGLLDRVLSDAALDQAFNNDPLVVEFLTLRISPLRLALPPVIEPRNGRLQLGTESLLTISDGVLNTTMLGHAWSTLELSFQQTAKMPHVSLQELTLSCEPRPQHLEACYPLLSQAVASRTSAFDQTLTDALATTLSTIFVGAKLQSDIAPAALQLKSLAISADVGKQNASIRLSIDAALSAP